MLSKIIPNLGAFLTKNKKRADESPPASYECHKLGPREGSFENQALSPAAPAAPAEPAGTPAAEGASSAEAAPRTASAEAAPRTASAAK